jgi:single-strand DNA-binding protein
MSSPLAHGSSFVRHGGRPARWHCKAKTGSLRSAFPFARPPAFESHNNHPHEKEKSMSTAPNLNSVTLVGQLTSDPVLRSLPDGRSVCDLRLAVNDRREQPLFIDVATFGPGADACAEYLSKGRAVAVTGRLVYREWKAKDGSKRSKHQVVGRVSFGSAGNHVAGGEKAGDDEAQDGDD